MRAPVFLALLSVLIAVPSSSLRRSGVPARYVVFLIDADGVPRAQSHRLVSLSAPPATRSDAEMESLRRAALRDRESIAVRMTDPRGALVLQDIVALPHWLKAERGLFGESAGPDDLLPAQKAFVVRLPLLDGARLALAPVGATARVKAAEFDLDALAADRNLPLAGFEPGAASVQPPPNSGNRVDLLIMSDGYTAAQQAKFNTDAASLIADFFSPTPYAEYKAFVNTSTLFTASAQAGADHPPYNAACPSTTFPPCCADTTMQTDPLQGTFVNTAFDATFCSFNIHRLLVVNTAKVLTAAGGSPGWDKILVLVNDATRGGSGGSVGVVSTHSTAVEIGRHEYGHSFAELADEYSTPFPAYPPCTDAPGTLSPCESNVTDETSRSAIKWNPWILGSTPIPTPGDDPTVVGLFQGARYLASGMYRPMFSCRMRNLGVAFCRICSQSYVLRLYEGGWGVPAGGIDTIEPGSESPPPGTVPLSLPGSRTFSVSLLQPQGNTVTGTWSVNGTPAGSGSSFTFSPSVPGTYTVLLTAHDGTSLVNSSMAGTLLNRTRTWTVHVTGGGPSSFYALTPCRLADTRDAPGPSGGPALSANAARSFPVTGFCGIPASATAVAINLAVFAPSDFGDLRVYPAGGAAPLASTLNFRPGIVRANNATVPLGAGGQISIQCDMPPGSAGTTHFFFDVFGYFE